MPAVGVTARAGDAARVPAPLVPSIVKAAGPQGRSGLQLAQALLRPRVPVAPPRAQQPTWDDELWRLQRLYGDAGQFACEVDATGDRHVQLTLHCTDPDWQAVNWAPEGLSLDVEVPACYPESCSPALEVKGPPGLPERFVELVPLLFAESVAQARPGEPAVYRGLQFVDRNLVTLWLKVRAAADAEEQREGEKEEPASVRRAREREEQAEEKEEILLPWGMEEDWQEARKGREGHEGRDAPAQEGGSEPSGRKGGRPAQDNVSWTVEDVKRQGAEVRLLGLSLEGVATLLVNVLRLQVVCSRCKKPTDMESEGTGVDPRAAEAPCPVCRQQLILRVAPAICHGGCPAIAHVLGVNCHAVQLLRSDFTATCSECTEAVRVRQIGPGYRKRAACAKCFAKQNLALEGAELLGAAVAQWRQVAAEEGERLDARRRLQDARKREKDLGIRVGQPLPNQGACKHFQKSYKWLRFPCCGRAYPCVECHDEEADHKHEWATRMLCGQCSFEQPFSKDSCRNCGAASTRARTAFWEGGEGCRNRAVMARNDPHKYRGLGKSTSSKAAAKSSAK